MTVEPTEPKQSALLQRARAVSSTVPWPTCLLAGTLSAWTLVVGDAMARSGWPYFSWWDHWTGALGMYAAVGALLGLLVAALLALDRLLFGRWQGRPRLRVALRALFFFCVAAAGSSSTAVWTFSGEQVQKTALSWVGPIVFAGGLGLAAAVAAVVLTRVAAALQRGSWVWAPWAVCFYGAGLLVSHVDLTRWVSLYSRVHTILEIVSALGFGAAYALAFAFLSRSFRVRRLVRSLGTTCAVWLAACVVVTPIRTWFDEALKHVWLEEVYAGRMLRRIQVAEAFLSNPFSWRGMHMARIERLKVRYAVNDVTLSPEWNAPLAEPKEVWDALRRLRGGQNRYNVVVYYVDTLRADVAEDPETMPAYAEFRRRSLDFQRAYAVGSDTLRSLPSLTGGNYDYLATPDNDVLRVAKRANYDSALAIAKSAYEFLGKLRPEFHFDRNLVVPDYPEEQQVWGYGAQQPTSAKIVDRALEFADEKRDKPFFLWLFNFDQHNWAQLDSSYVDAKEQRFKLSDDPGKPKYRYRVVARSIDEQFGRLIQGLEQRKLLDDTIVLFVSDHGEALGKDGFWVHSVFLWESLIRVPLSLYVPKLEPRVVSRKVSLVDVAPTLGRYLDPTLNGAGFQGEDLLTQLLPEPPSRRFPLLVVSASKDLLVRVGLVDPVADFKLIVSFEAALPELYRLGQPDPDAKNFASEHLERVRAGVRLLARSPIFPREPDDFSVRDTRLQRKELAAQAAAAEALEEP